MKLALWLIILLIIPSAFATTCGDYTFTAPVGNLYCGGGQEFAFAISYSLSGFSPGPIDANFHVDYESGLNLIGNQDFTHPVYADFSSSSPNPLLFNCSTSGNYQVNLTVNDSSGEGSDECFFHVNITTAQMDEPNQQPNISITMPTIPNLELDNNYTFNLTLENVGDGTAYNISGLISLLGGQLVSFENITLLKNETHVLFFNITANTLVLNHSFELNNFYYLNNHNDTSSSFFGNPQSNYFSITSPPEIRTNINFFENSLFVNFSLTYSLVESSTLDYTRISIYDSDPYDNDGNFTYDFRVSDDNITYYFNETSLFLIINSTPGWYGQANFTLIVTDQINFSGNSTFTIVVQNESVETCNGEDDDGDWLIDEGINGTQVYCPTSCCVEGFAMASCVDGNVSIIYTECEINNDGGNHGDGSNLVFDVPDGELVHEPSSGIKIINTLITFDSYMNLDSLCRWDFGDGETAIGCEVEHTYAELGDYEVIFAYGGSFSIIELNIRECVSSNQCSETQVCCGEDNSCVDYNTCSLDNCQQSSNHSILFIDYLCSYDDVCQTSCTYETCEVECSEDSHCGMSSDSTIFSCEGSGTCESYCEETSLELEIFLHEPIDQTIFYDTRIPVHVETSENGAECQYQLNENSIHSITQELFHITADYGEHTLTIWCSGNAGVETETISFSVYYENEEQAENIGGNAKYFDNPFRDDFYRASVGEVIYVVGQVFELVKGVEVSPKQSRSVPGSGVSEIVFTLSNDNPVRTKNIVITETIDKQLTPLASSITSPYSFIIIEEDPIIEFNLPFINPYDEVELVYSLPIEGVTSSDIHNFIQTQYIIPNISKEEEEEFINQTLQTQENIKIYKDKKEEGNKTTYTNILKPKKVMEDVDVYLNIPKCMAEHVNEIQFEDTNFNVISEDPLIMWHLEEMDGDVDYEYVLDGLIDEDCESEASIIAVARIIQDTLVEDNDQKSAVYVVVPLLIIPLILLILLIVFHFNPEKQAYYYASFCRVDSNNSKLVYPHPADEIMPPAKPKT
jgi:hypothetical protein